MTLGRIIGKVVAIDWNDKNGNLDSFIRLRVELDIEKPLRWLIVLKEKNNGFLRVSPIN